MTDDPLALWQRALHDRAVVSFDWDDRTASPRRFALRVNDAIINAWRLHAGAPRTAQLALYASWCSAKLSREVPADALIDSVYVRIAQASLGSLDVDIAAIIATACAGPLR